MIRIFLLNEELFGTLSNPQNISKSQGIVGKHHLKKGDSVIPFQLST